MYVHVHILPCKNWLTHSNQHSRASTRHAWLTYAFFTVETGFQASEITLLEGSSEMVCLNTFGELLYIH